MVLGAFLLRELLKKYPLSGGGLREGVGGDLRCGWWSDVLFPVWMVAEVGAKN